MVSHQASLIVSKHYLHVPREFDLNISQPALILHVPQCPNAVNDERVRNYGLLETLLSGP